METTELRSFELKKIQGKAQSAKVFFPVGKYKVKATGKNAPCQIKGCDKPAQWLITIEGMGSVFCFDHGEEI